jgi:hypothetical protein
MLNKAAESTLPMGQRRELPIWMQPRRTTQLISAAKGREAGLCWFERDLVSAPGSAALDLIALGSVAMPSFVKAGYY